MMKKTALVTALALLGVVGAASVNAASQPQQPQTVTETIPVHFKGKVEASSCMIQVGTASNSVDLGRVSPKENSTGAVVPIKFGFSGCDGKTIKTIKFDGGQNGGEGGGDVPDRGVLGTDKANVFVELYKDAQLGGGGKGFDPTVNVNAQIETGGKLSVTPFYARLKVGGFPAQAGTVSSAALFTVSYQ